MVIHIHKTEVNIWRENQRIIFTEYCLVQTPNSILFINLIFIHILDPFFPILLLKGTDGRTQKHSSFYNIDLIWKIPYIPQISRVKCIGIKMFFLPKNGNSFHHLILDAKFNYCSK